MYTEQTEVTSKASIWAIPKSESSIQYELQDNPGVVPETFFYKIYAGYSTPYESGAVKVHEFEVVAFVPAGINLVEKAIETLESEIKTIKADAYESVTKLEARIQSLQYITHQPEPTV